MQEESWELSVCPSFNSYSSDKLADVAAQVTREFDHRDHDDEGAFEENEEFEFVSVRKAEDDVVVLDGQIGPVFPVFNRDLLLSDQNPTKSQQITDGHDLKNREGEGEGEGEGEEEGEDVRCLRIPLKKLLSEEHDPTSYSSSSSEVDELEGVPPGTYCVWTPQSNSSPKAIAAAASPSQCKKSNSTGTTTSSNTKSSSSSSSKRWRLMNLLRRSNSEGKDSFVFLTPKNKEEEISYSNNSFADENSNSNSKEIKKVVAVKKKKKEKEQTVSSAHEVFYGRKRESMERDKRKTYLPYRKDLVGFWASVGSLGRTFPPF
ncbi:hypothetical protein CMV_000387 [Castanea mollissima]|uniref:Uncharacterized protein n=1 Tax=Castanea mollissima TaxID=60419 RepID=A0A8J4S1D7_9ROSI|nr:hypothetical protein CMV_000387 [Castanea mollissima]